MSKPDFVFSVLQLACLVCLVAQIILGFDVVNLECALLAASGCILTLQYFKVSRSFVDYPMSSLALLGLSVTSMMTSLISQSLFLNPISSYLRVPVYTYSVLTAVLLVTVCMHWAYRRLTPLTSIRTWIATRVFTPLHLIEVPSAGALWVLGFVGALALMKGRSDTGDSGGKLIQALWGFAWMPFLIPFYYRKLGDGYCNAKLQWPAVLTYALVLMAIGMALNTRTLMVAGPVAAMLIYFIFTVQDYSEVTKRHFVKTALIATSFMVGVLLFSQLATAMVVVRGDREKIEPEKLIRETFSVLFYERHKMAAVQDVGYINFRLGHYNEYYIPNSVLARFSDTKFADNVLSVARDLDDRGANEIWQYTKDRLEATLPQPVLDAIDSKFDKDNYYYSDGDMYHYLDTGGERIGFLVGSIWADLITLAGPWFLLAVAGINLISFIALDSLSKKGGSITRISPVIICMGWSIILFGLSGESLASRLQFWIRGLPQAILLYMAAYFLVRISLNSVRPPRSARHLRETPLWSVYYDKFRGKSHRWVALVRRSKLK